jgi:Protein of unknown function (DUF3800)
VSETSSPQPVRVPLRYQTSVIYIDESGVATKEPIFVVAALKVRRHGQFSRAIRAVRERTGYESEFHWSTVSRGGLPAYFELIDTLANSDAHFAATVVDRARYNPADKWPSLWEAHAQVVSQLLIGCINRSELVGVLMDTISTPSDVAIEDYVRAIVNNRLASTSVVTAACLNSKASDGLQAVDLLAGALAWERRCSISGQRPSGSHKAKLADRIRTRFNFDPLLDGRTPRTNVLTLRGLPPARRSGSRARPRPLD